MPLMKELRFVKTHPLSIPTLYSTGACAHMLHLVHPRWLITFSVVRIVVFLPLSFNIATVSLRCRGTKLRIQKTATLRLRKLITGASESSGK